MGNFRSAPPPGALKEGSTKPESISPRKTKAPPEPVIQSSLEAEKIQALKEIFNKLKSNPDQRTVSEEEFLVIIYFIFYCVYYMILYNADIIMILSGHKI